MYDHSYGVTQPYATYTIIQKKAPQPRRAQGGIAGDLYDAGADIGSYLWSYMPAPMRGGGSPYQVPPGSGVVSEFYVPGTR
ncbi:MAG: hypothetical protein AB1646_06255 [Thermodesulfobacteriota bacterium]